MSKNSLTPATARAIKEVSRKLQEITKILNDITDVNSADIVTTQDGLMETYEAVDENTTLIGDCNNALIELYEMIGGNE